MRTVPNPTGKSPNGLNAAIAAPRHEVIARVDGHAEIPTDYVATAVAELTRVDADNVGGLMLAEGRTAFERAVACAMRSPIGVGNARFHVGGGAGEADTVYLGVFRRSALERVGGYDEHFARAQDWEMNHRIRQTGGRVWFTPDLKVTYRPRSAFAALGKQFFYYGRWRRVVARHHVGTINVRYLAPPVMVAGTTLAVAAGFLWWPAWLVPAAYGVAIAGRRPGDQQGRVAAHPPPHPARPRRHALVVGHRVRRPPTRTGTLTPCAFSCSWPPRCPPTPGCSARRPPWSLTAMRCTSSARACRPTSRRRRG